MATDANLLLVSSGTWPERIVRGLEERGAFVEVIRPEGLELSFQVVGPDLVVHYGLEGAKAVLAFLSREPEGRPIRLVLVGPRAELPALRKFDRRVVLGVLADDLPEKTICERITTLAARKQEASPSVPLPSAKTPSVPPEVNDPLLERRIPSDTARPETSPSGHPSPSEESIRTWFQSSPPPRISEKPDAFEEESAAEDEPPPGVEPAVPQAFEELPSLDPIAPGDAELGLGASAAELSEELRLEETVSRAASAAHEEAPVSELDIQTLPPEPEDDNPELDAADRETLIMETEPNDLEPADSVSDRETLHAPLQTSREELSVPATPAAAKDGGSLGGSESSAVSSVSSLVASVDSSSSSEPKEKPPGRARAPFVIGAVAIAACAAFFFLPRSGDTPPAPEEAPAAAEPPLDPLPAEPGREENAPAEPQGAGVNIWTREPEAGVKPCTELLGDVSLLRFGDIDQNALFWKKARGKLMLGDREGALAELCRAAHIFPSGLAVEALVELLLDMGAAPLAEPFMEQAKKARPHRPKTLELYGDLKSQLGETSEARTIWLEALGTANASEKVLHQIGRQLVAQAEAVLAGGQVGLGERLFRRAAILDPSSSAALLGLARLAEERGDAERARKFRELSESLSAAP
jgi:tetratricopeptide (TPR) repeat protein